MSTNEYKNISAKDFIEDYRNSEGKMFNSRLRIVDALSFANVTLHTIEFEDCIFDNYVGITVKKENCSIAFDKCAFTQGITLKGSQESLANISISKCTECRHIKIYGSYKAISIETSCKELEVSDCQGESLIIRSFSRPLDFINSLTFEHSSFRRINLKDIQINKFSFNANIANDAEVSIEEVQCAFFGLSDMMNDGKFRIYDLSTGKGKRKKDILVKDSIFSLYKCNLGKAEFYNIQLDDFSAVGIFQSVISDCVFTNVNWPSRLNSNPFSINDFSYKREVYRQVKFALSKQGNSIEEQIFHAKELNEYYKSLTYKTHPWTKLIIGLSWITSNYGQSIIRPLIFLGIVNGFLFLGLYKLESSLVITAVESGKITNIVGAFVHYINPLHKFDDSFVGMQIVIDSLMRVISSYSIYNFIRASRRFIK